MECHDCLSPLETSEEKENGWCDMCFIGVRLGDDLYG